MSDFLSIVSLSIFSFVNGISYKKMAGVKTKSLIYMYIPLYLGSFKMISVGMKKTSERNFITRFLHFSSLKKGLKINQ